MSALQKLTTEHTEYTERVRFMNNKRMNLLQKLIMEHIGRAERARFMSKRVIFQPFKACKKIFYALFWTEDKSIFSLCDLYSLCGETIAFLQ